MQMARQVAEKSTDSQTSTDSRSSDFKTKIRKDYISGLRVRYAERGESNEHNVLLIHGGGVSCGFVSWSEVIRTLGNTHHVYAPDLPGYGGSEKAIHKATLKRNAEFIEKFMKRMRIKQTHIVAESFGGGIAMEYTLQHKEKVQSLTLIDSYGFVQKHLPVAAYALTRINAGIQQKVIKSIAKNEVLFGTALKVLLRDCEGVALTNDQISVVQDYVTQNTLTKACLEFVQSEVTLNGLRTNFRKRMDEINRLEIPILFIHGTQDPMFPIELQRKAAARIKGARFVPIEAAHQPEQTHPNLVNREILQLLRSVN